MTRDPSHRPRDVPPGSGQVATGKTLPQAEHGDTQERCSPHRDRQVVFATYAGVATLIPQCPPGGDRSPSPSLQGGSGYEGSRSWWWPWSPPRWRRRQPRPSTSLAAPRAKDGSFRSSRPLTHRILTDPSAPPRLGYQAGRRPFPRPHRFGPTNSSSRATLPRLATDRHQGLLGRHPMPSWSHTRPKIPRIPVGTDDSELVQAPRARGEASVSQVEAKQIAIRRLPERQWVATADLAPWPRWLVRDPRPVEHRGPAFPPLPDRATRDTGLPRNLAVVTTGSDKLKDQHDFLARAHLRYPPRQARVAKRETLMAQTHLPERACGFDSRLGHPSPAT